MAEGREKEQCEDVQYSAEKRTNKVEDWLVLEEDNLKHPQLEIRLCLKGRALQLSESIKREDLKKKRGEREILKVLDKAYMNDKRVNRIMNIK